MSRSDEPERAGLCAQVTAIVPHYQTPDLLQEAVRSFRRFYPDVRLLIVDNGSADGSTKTIRALEEESDGFAEGLLLERNLFHGPAMDVGIRRVETPYVFLLDSDTVTRKGGFLEEMAALLDASPECYGAGRVVTVNRRGFAAPKGVTVLSSAYMLLKRSVYLSLPPFIHHGLPALLNFRAASERGLRLDSYPVEGYVAHLGRGTASRYGYGLGLRARVDYLMNKLGL